MLAFSSLSLIFSSRILLGEIINNEGEVAKLPLIFFHITANVYKSITYRNTETNDKMKGPYIFHD